MSESYIKLHKPRQMNINREIDHLFDTLYSLENSNDFIEGDKIHMLYKTLNIIMDLYCSAASLRFTTLFSKISWVTNKLNLNAHWVYKIQLFRRSYERHEIPEQDVHHFISLGITICHNLLCHYENRNEKLRELPNEENEYFNYKKESNTIFKNEIECLIHEINEKEYTFTFTDEAYPDLLKTGKYDISDKNEIFTPNLLRAKTILTLPFHANLIDVTIIEGSIYIPSAIIINPDYLIDVTAIASAVKDDEGEHWLYVLNKLFEKDLKNKPILIGNLVNQLLDALVHQEDLTFEDVTKTFFQFDPIAWAVFDDKEVKDVIIALEKHFNNLKRVIQVEFKQFNISKDNIYLEPSFYSRKYGIQGRLDLLHITDTLADIVELKSAKPFKPNAYGITHSHFNQALLYDLIFSSSDYQHLKRNTFILYSILEEANLKYANIIKSRQYELLKIRNELVLIDHALASTVDMTERIIHYLKSSNFPGLTGFSLTNINTFEAVFLSINSLEKAYYIQFINFINKEHLITKTGDSNYEASNGQASLWLDTEEEKRDRFALLNYLRIIENKSNNDDAVITFEFTPFSSRLSNFRKGDIVVLYPHHFNSNNILKHQIFKCTLLENDDTGIKIRLRNVQKNQNIFKQFEFWNIEQDFLDSSFKHMYRNLFYLITAEEEKRQLILGQRQPETYTKQVVPNLHVELTSEQKKIINNIISCKDYFLLWGPPGTGKTSLVIKHLTRVLFDQSNEKVFLIAYTNRAVDEICDALIQVGLQQEYIRIGSSTAVSEISRPNLLNEKIKAIQNRKEIVDLIGSTRIYVSTVSSLMGKLELFSITEFDTIIVDEASQILEPMLSGLLTKFRKFVLIGDHKQLPAVVAQKEAETKISKEVLNQHGFYSTKTSLFERLYMQCLNNNWIHAFDILSHQGRMHKDIMNFVNQHFYESKLKLIPSIERLTKSMQSNYQKNNTHWLCQHRMLFINSTTALNAKWKTNADEAEKVSQVIQLLKVQFNANGKIWDESSIGVITPYRAQISLIKSMLPADHKIMVDTVERYQGGAKDIIIISFCTNKLSQLNTLIVNSDQGVDRKLNVALTRAKEQIIIIGNEDILITNPVYQKLITYCKKVNL